MTQPDSPAAAAEEPYRYWAFISYSHADAAWARWLHRGLEGYRIPARLVGREGATGAVPKKLFPVFRDRDELAGAAELGPELQRALRRSRFQVVIASPRAAASRWVEQEIRYFKSLGRAARVLALIVDGEPNAADPARECFPQALRFQVDAQGRLTEAPAELVAADARKGADGKGNALLKLIAGILGVGFDDLRQRELQARNRRLAALASIATAVSVVTIALAVVAHQARNDALRRQQQAEDLLQFMLGDLREKLEPIGKLAILDAVGRKAMDYYATLDESDVTDTALASRATALRQIGEVRIKQGDLGGAEEAYRESLQLDEELVRRHPDRADYAYNLAESVYSMGYARYVKGELEAARPWLERYAGAARQLEALEPGNARWVDMAAQAEMNLGALAYGRKDLGAAREAFGAAIARQRALVEAEPGNRAFIETLADLHGWQCTVESDRRDWPAAVEQAARQTGLQQRLLELAPDDANYRYGLATSSVRLLRNQAQLSPLEADAPVLRETLRVTSELAALDPENVEFANLRAVALSFLVDAHLGTDQLHAAEAAAQQGLELARATWQRAPADLQARRGLLLVLGQSTKLALLRGDRAAARARLQEARALPEPPPPDAVLATLEFDLDLLGWWLVAGTGQEAAAEVRATQTLRRVEASGTRARPELMLRYAALRGDRAEAGRWFGQLTDGERRQPFVQAFCRATGAC